MIDWIEKLPDSITGTLLAATVWFGFNYGVVADRAMEKDHVTGAGAQCIESLEDRERSMRIPQIGGPWGMPELDTFFGKMAENFLPPPLSAEQKHSRCRCAAKHVGAKVKFDYAIHTATFRLVSPQAVGEFGADTIKALHSGVCGALPRIGMGS